MNDANDVNLEVILDAPEPTPPRKLTGWLVFAFSLVICGTYLVGNTIPLVPIAMLEAAKNPAFDPELWAEAIQLDGFALAICTFGGTLLGVPAIFLSTSYQKVTSITEYLALRKVSWLTCLSWIGVTLALLTASDFMTSTIGKQVIPEFMRQVYTSPGALPWLWIALIIFAPLIEELFFRGFLFTGLQSNGVGIIGTAVITSLLWAIIHVQYGPYEIGLIFLGGLVLSYARFRSRSIVPCMLMHAVANLVATIQVDMVT